MYWFTSGHVHALFGRNVDMSAFYVFLRYGEFTCRKNEAPFVAIGDVTVARDFSQFTLFLKTSKTDPFGKGVPVVIFEKKTCYSRYIPCASI